MQDPKTWKDVQAELYPDLFNICLEYILPDKLEMKKSFNDVIFSIDSLNMCSKCGKVRLMAANIGSLFINEFTACLRVYRSSNSVCEAHRIIRI
jgi:hypothetical protein